MEIFYTGKTVCPSCKREVSWFCMNKNAQWESLRLPTGTQMTHSYDYANKKEMFDGYCECGARIRLPDEVVAQIPQEYYADL